MARPALSAERTVEILNFMAAHPLESFTLSELAARLGINKASTHAVLATLTDAGYLLRHPRHKTYELGPTLVAVGHAALERHRAIDVAREEIRRLADLVDAEVVASTVIGDEIVIVARAGRPGPSGLFVGTRVPFVPPLGTIFLAWASDAEVDGWLHRVGPRADADDIERFRAAIGEVRARGYSVGLAADAQARLNLLLSELGERPPQRVAGRAALDAAIAELVHAEYNLLDATAVDAEVHHIAAPVFGHHGEVVLALTVDGFGEPLAAGDVARPAALLERAARTVTTASGGRPPRR